MNLNLAIICTISELSTGYPQVIHKLLLTIICYDVKLSVMNKCLMCGNRVSPPRKKYCSSECFKKANRERSKHVMRKARGSKLYKSRPCSCCSFPYSRPYRNAVTGVKTDLCPNHYWLLVVYSRESE